MQIGVFAKTFPGDRPDKVLAACKDAGFGLAQYNMSCSGLGPLPALISSETAEQISSASDANGVKIAAISATYNMTDPDVGRRKAGRRAFAAIAANAARIGSNLLTVCSGSMDPQDQWRRHPANDDPETWTEMCREFDIILGDAEQHNLFVGVEPEHGNVVSSAHKAMRLLDAFPGSRIRIVFDPANILEGVPPGRQRATIDEALDLLGPEIVLAHAKDRFADGRVAPAGAGTIDWGHVLRGLSRVGFDGPVVAHGMSASDAPAVARYLNHVRAQF